MSTLFMKEQIAKEQLRATQIPKEKFIKPREEPVIKGQDACAHIRELKVENRAQKARIAFLETQLANVIDENTMLKASKKHKLVPKPSGNKKLTGFAAILGTQQAQDLEAEEEWK